MSGNGQNFENLWARSQGSLYEVIHGTVVNLQESADFCVELDIPSHLHCPADGDAIAQLVGTLVGSSLEACTESEHGEVPCELLITACELGGRVEIEVADNGPAADSRPHRIPLVTAQLNANLFWQDCPQGGVAVTVVIPVSQQVRKAA